MNEKQKFKRTLELAKQGNVAEQGRVGIYYVQGVGTDRNMQNGIKWLVKAANNGHVLARISLSQIYGYGHGVHRDFVKGAGWGAGQKLLLEKQNELVSEEVLLDYIKARQSDPEAQFDLGMMHLQGRKILGGKNEKNDAVGLAWIQKAAQNGHKYALVQLADMSAKGNMVEKDPSKAWEMVSFVKNAEYKQ